MWQTGRTWVRAGFVLVLALALPVAVAGEERGELWGHLRYHEATRLANAGPVYPQGSLAPQIFSCRVAPEVIEPLRALIATAASEGKQVVAASCFRSVDSQVDVFYGPAHAAGAPSFEALKKTALLIAPPGFSEHHTGYAIDFCDGAHPETCENLDIRFAESEAGRWLMAHGADYGFELSFPKTDDPCVKASGRVAQGVAYEPWHWRFVGNPAAREVFARARARFAICPRAAMQVSDNDPIADAFDQFRSIAQDWLKMLRPRSQ